MRTTPIKNTKHHIFIASQKIINTYIFLALFILTYDEKDEQIQKLEEFWNDFVVKTKNKKRLVLVEGGKRKILNSKKESIEVGGEIGYVAFLLFLDCNTRLL